MRTTLVKRCFGHTSTRVLFAALYSWTCGTHITSSTSPPFLSFFTEVSSYLRHDCGRCLRTAGSIGASTDGQREPAAGAGRRGDCRDVHARPFPRLIPASSRASSEQRGAWLPGPRRRVPVGFSTAYCGIAPYRPGYARPHAVGCDPQTPHLQRVV